PLEDGLPDAVEEALASLRPELTAIVAAMTKLATQPAAQAALARMDLQGLQEARVLTRELKVHGNTFRGDRRAGVAAEIAAVDDLLARVERRRRLAALNDLGERYMQAYEWYAAGRDGLKREAGVAEFP